MLCISGSPEHACLECPVLPFPQNNLRLCWLCISAPHAVRYVIELSEQINKFSERMMWTTHILSWVCCSADVFVRKRAYSLLSCGSTGARTQGPASPALGFLPLKLSFMSVRLRVYMCTTCIQCSSSPDEGLWSPRTRVSDGPKSCGCWELIQVLYKSRDKWGCWGLKAAGFLCRESRLLGLVFRAGKSACEGWLLFTTRSSLSDRSVGCVYRSSDLFGFQREAKKCEVHQSHRRHHLNLLLLWACTCAWVCTHGATL